MGGAAVGAECELKPLVEVENKWQAGQKVSISFAKWDAALVDDDRRTVDVQFEEPGVNILSVYNADIRMDAVAALESAGTKVKFHMLAENPEPSCTPAGQDAAGNELPPICVAGARRSFEFQMSPISRIVGVSCHLPWPPPPRPHQPPRPVQPPPSPIPSLPPPPVELLLDGCPIGGTVLALDDRVHNSRRQLQMLCVPGEWRAGYLVMVHFSGQRMSVTELIGNVQFVSNDPRCIGPDRMPSENSEGATFCFKLISVPTSFGKPTQFSFKVEGDERTSPVWGACWGTSGVFEKIEPPPSQPRLSPNQPPPPLVFSGRSIEGMVHGPPSNPQMAEPSWVDANLNFIDTFLSVAILSLIGVGLILTVRAYQPPNEPHLKPNFMQYLQHLAYRCLRKQHDSVIAKSCVVYTNHPLPEDTNLSKETESETWSLRQGDRQVEEEEEEADFQDEKTPRSCRRGVSISSTRQSQQATTLIRPLPVHYDLDFD